jgi:mono/diheme cytochrome c family protein
MYQLKFTITFIFFALTVVGCIKSRNVRYSITNSKTYEATLFRQNCAICHGPEGEGKTTPEGKLIPNIRDGVHKYNTDAEIYNHISNGGNGMVPFRGILTDREINLLVEFVKRDLRNNK